jgi:3-isopropylmalate/(R)-2-methylmalate dehydratase small subunit
MNKFIEVTSIAIPLPMKDVDTDMIIPAQYLTQISKTGYGENVFARLKATDKDFPFNLPKYQESQILISGSNFGCGSSREHAVWAIQQAGINVIIATSYSDIFAGNSAKNGLLLISLDDAVMNQFFAIAEKEDLIITVNLENQTVYCKNTDEAHHFDYDPFRKECLLNGQDDMDFLLAHADKIDTFKNQQVSF